MTVRIVAIGKVKEPYYQHAIADFIRRIAPFCRLDIIELKDEGVKKEAEKLKKYLTPSTFVLDAKGKQFSSEEFAAMLKQRELIFVIGGPEGISDEIKTHSTLLSLSRMTFLHEMSRLILLEQIYR